MNGERTLPKLPFGLGLVLLLGGAAHTIGVAHFYALGRQSLGRTDFYSKRALRDHLDVGC